MAMITTPCSPEKKSVLFVAALALTLRLALWAVFQSTVLYQPTEGSGHDRALYLDAMARVAGGAWFPEGSFAYLPLYPWLAGLLGMITGADAATAALFGIACDTITAGLLVALALRLGATRRWASAAGLLYAAYPLAAWYSLLTMPNTLNTLLVTLTAWLAAAPGRWTRGRAVMLGLAGGVGTLGFAGLPGMTAVALIMRAWRDRSVLPAVLGLAAMALPIAPVAWHNTRAEGRWTMLTTHGGFNFYMGNHERATGYPLRVLDFRMTARLMLDDAHRHAEKTTGRELSRAESSAWWKEQANRFWREQPGRAVALTIKKLALFWNFRDVDDLRIIEQARIAEPGLRWVRGTPFLVFSLLGIAGLCWARGAGVSKAMLVTGMAGLVLFFITARYRLTFVPLMAALGAAGCSVAWASRKTWTWRPWACGLALAALVFLPFAVRDQRPIDHYNVALHLMEAERIDEAMKVIERGLAIDPRFPDLHFARGSAFFKREQFAAAAESFRTAIAGNPNQPVAWFNLALSLARDNRLTEARDALLAARQSGIPLTPHAATLLDESGSALKY